LRGSLVQSEGGLSSATTNILTLRWKFSIKGTVATVSRPPTPNPKYNIKNSWYKDFILFQSHIEYMIAFDFLLDEISILQV